MCKIVRQRDDISIQCNLEHTFRKINWNNNGIATDGELTHLRFSDDIILISEDPTEL